MKGMKELRGEERERGGSGSINTPTRRQASSFLIKERRQCYLCAPEERLVSNDESATLPRPDPLCPPHLRPVRRPRRMASSRRYYVVSS